MVELSLRNVLDSSVLNELLQDSVENGLGFFESRTCLISSKAGYDLVLDDFKEEVELICFNEELQRNDYHLQVVILLQ